MLSGYYDFYSGMKHDLPKRLLFRVYFENNELYFFPDSLRSGRKVSISRPLGALFNEIHT